MQPPDKRKPEPLSDERLAAIRAGCTQYDRMLLTHTADAATHRDFANRAWGYIVELDTEIARLRAELAARDEAAVAVQDAAAQLEAWTQNTEDFGPLAEHIIPAILDAAVMLKGQVAP